MSSVSSSDFCGRRISLYRIITIYKCITLCQCQIIRAALEYDKSTVSNFLSCCGEIKLTIRGLSHESDAESHYGIITMFCDLINWPRKFSQL